MSHWSHAKLTHNQALTKGLHRLVLEVTQDVSTAFHSAGQYHRVRVGREDALFAIASPPRVSAFEYLVNTQGEVARAWASLGVGAQVEVTVPEGPGFPLTKAEGKTLLLIGTGTGFGPLRSVVSALRVRRGDFGPVYGLYGARTPTHVAWAPELEALADDEVHIQSVVQQAPPNWKGATGRVQHHLGRLPTRNAVAFLCGHPEMVADVTAALTARGVPRDHIFLNFI
jgi:NAD(P)H-flavin reductase